MDILGITSLEKFWNKDLKYKYTWWQNQKVFEILNFMKEKKEFEWIFHSSIFDVLKNQWFEGLNKSNFVWKSITLVRHPEIIKDKTKDKWELLITEDWVKKIENELEPKIRSTFWNNFKNIKIFCNIETKRIEWFLKKLELDLNVSKKNIFSNLEWLKTVGKESRKSSINVAKRIDLVLKSWNFNNEIFKKLFNSDDINWYNNLFLVNSIIFANAKSHKNDPIWLIKIDNRYIKFLETMVYDIDLNWNLVKNDTSILELDLENIPEILIELKNNNIFKDIIDDYEKWKIDFKVLQNSINYFFFKEWGGNLFQKYINSKSYILSDFCLKNILEINNKNNKNIDEIILNILENRQIENLETFFEIILRDKSNIDILKNVIKKYTENNKELFKLLNNNLSEDYKAKIFENNKKDLFLNLFYSYKINLTENLDKFQKQDYNEFIIDNNFLLSNLKTENREDIEYFKTRLFIDLTIPILDEINIKKMIYNLLIKIEKNILINLEKVEIKNLEDWKDLLFKISDEKVESDINIVFYYLEKFKINNSEINKIIKKLKNVYEFSEKSIDERLKIIKKPKKEIILSKELIYIYENKLNKIYKEYIETGFNNKDLSFPKIKEQLLPILKKYSIHEIFFEEIVKKVEDMFVLDQSNFIINADYDYLYLKNKEEHDERIL